jgi:hypothetical protein
VSLSDFASSIKDFNTALEMIPKEKDLGFVLNHIEASLDNYYQRYTHGPRE